METFNTKEFEEHHYTALRRLRNHPINQAFDGVLSIKIDYDNFTRMALQHGLIEIATYEIALREMKSNPLKQILRQYGLNASGRKEELIKRIIGCLSEAEVRKSEYYTDIYIVTEEGEKLIRGSYEKLEEEKIERFKYIINLILEEDMDEIYNIFYGDSTGQIYIDDETKRAYHEQLKSAHDKLTEAVIIYHQLSGDTWQNIRLCMINAYNFSDSDMKRLITKNSERITERELRYCKEAGIEKYCFYAPLDLRTCPECAELDGKIFRVVDGKIGLNCPPMHDGCRCHIIGLHSDDWLRNAKRSTRDPVTYKSESVPGNMNYKEWYTKYVKGREHLIDWEHARK